MATELAYEAVNGHNDIYARGYATGAAAMDHKLTVQVGKIVSIERVTLKFSAAPTTSESFTITIDSDIAAGTYDTLVYTTDPSSGSVTDIALGPDQFEGMVFFEGEEIDFAYTNTDTRTWGLTIVYKEL